MEGNKQDIFNLGVDEEARAHLLETARWTKFIAIIGFVILGLLILVGILMGLGLSVASQMYDTANLGSAFGTAMMVMYLVLSLLYFFPILYLYKFSVLIKPAIHTGNQQQFNLALSYQKRMYKFIGIMLLVVFGLYAVMIIAAILGAAFSSV